MDHEFAAAIARWQNFESLAGSIAATLLGLLFVAVSIRPALFRQNDDPALLSIAAKSMDLFMLVIVIALVFQIPDIRPRGMGIALAILAVISMVNTMHHLAILRRISHEWGPLFLARRILLPTLGYVLLLTASAAMYNSDVEWLAVLAITQILFLFTGTHNAWDLLLRVGKS